MRYVYGVIGILFFVSICLADVQKLPQGCLDNLQDKKAPKFKISKAELLAELKKVRNSPYFSGSGRSSYLNLYLKKVAEKPTHACPASATKDSLKQLRLEQRYSCCEKKGICNIDSSVDSHQLFQMAYDAYLKEYYSGLMSLFGHSPRIKSLNVENPHLKDPYYLRDLAESFEHLEGAPDFDSVVLDVDSKFFAQFDDVAKQRKHRLVLMKEGVPQGIVDSYKQPYPLTRNRQSSLLSIVDSNCKPQTSTFSYNRKNLDDKIVLNSQSCERMEPILNQLSKNPKLKNCFFKLLDDLTSPSTYHKQPILNKFGALPSDFMFNEDGIFRKFIVPGFQNEQQTIVCAYKESQNPQDVQSIMQSFFLELRAFNQSYRDLFEIVTKNEGEGLKHLDLTRACDVFLNHSQQMPYNKSKQTQGANKS